MVDLAHTFNQMAENIQSNDNSRGQFMGNIAHELRAPMTTIKGFVDGILDGTIPVSYTHLDVYKRQILRAMSDNADEDGHEVLVVKKFSIAEYVATATRIVAAMVEAL